MSCVWWFKHSCLESKHVCIAQNCSALRPTLAHQPIALFFMSNKIGTKNPAIFRLGRGILVLTANSIAFSCAIRHFDYKFLFSARFTLSRYQHDSKLCHYQRHADIGNKHADTRLGPGHSVGDLTGEKDGQCDRHR